MALAATAVSVGCGSGSRGVATSAITIQPAKTVFPAPPPGAVVFSRRIRAVATAVALVPAGNRVQVQASLVGPQGNGLRGVPVRLAVGDATRRGVPCGAGCYRATFDAPHPSSVTVDTLSTHWRVALPSAWPPPDAAALVRRADRTYRALRSVAFHDTFASGTYAPLITEWRAAAPNRLAYDIRGGSSAIIIGAKRWDRADGDSKWVEREQLPVSQPAPLWAGVADAHVVASSPTIQRVTFFDPKTPGWFAAEIDRGTSRTLSVQMIATSHFMHETYRAFNSAVPIRPPR